MLTTFRPYQPDQLLLLAPDLQEWLPAASTIFIIKSINHAVRTTRMKSLNDATRRFLRRS